MLQEIAKTFPWHAVVYRSRLVQLWRKSYNPYSESSGNASSDCFRRCGICFVNFEQVRAFGDSGHSSNRILRNRFRL